MPLSKSLVDWIDCGEYFADRDTSWGDRDLVSEANKIYVEDIIQYEKIEDECFFEDNHFFVAEKSKKAEWARDIAKQLKDYPLISGAEDILYELEDEVRSEICYEEAYECAIRFVNSRDDIAETLEQVQTEIANYIGIEMDECGYGYDDYPERETVVKGYRRFLQEWSRQNYKRRPFQSVVESMLGDGYKTYIRDGIRYTTNKTYTVVA